MIPQTAAQWRNLLIFVAVAVANIVVIAVAAALGGDTMPGFREGEPLRPGKDQAIGLLALLAPIISGWIVQNRPRFGSEGLAAEVDARRREGYARDDLTVIPKADVLDHIAPTPEPEPTTYPVIHRSCNATAFLTIVPPLPGLDIDLAQARHTDGRPWADTDPIRCDGCRADLASVLVDDGRWVTVSAPATFGGA